MEKTVLSRTYQELSKRSMPIIKHYHADLTKHDWLTLSLNPGLPFIHLTRDSGTHIYIFYPSDHPEWPKKHELAPFLFSKVDRTTMLHEMTSGFKYLLSGKCMKIELILYFDGTSFHQIGKNKAEELWDTYKRKVDIEWERQK